jgi:hypothetical protein
MLGAPVVSPPSPRRGGSRFVGPALARALARLALLALVLAAVACIAPTLPVPPPAQPDVSAPDSAGLVTVTGAKGSVAAYAEVSVFNQTYAESAECKAAVDCTPGVFRNANADGSYLVRIQGRSKDLLYVWQTTGGGESAATEVHVR